MGMSYCIDIDDRILIPVDGITVPRMAGIEGCEPTVAGVLDFLSEKGYFGTNTHIDGESFVTVESIPTTRKTGNFDEVVKFLTDHVMPYAKNGEYRISDDYGRESVLVANNPRLG